MRPPCFFISLLSLPAGSPITAQPEYMKKRMPAMFKLFPLVFLLSILLPAACKKTDKGSPSSIAGLPMVTPPGPPPSGYGSKNYPYTSVVKRDYNDGQTGFMLYYPAAPHADSLPVVIFNHGFGEWNPINYGAWINHLILRGNIVIFPIFQTDLNSPSSASVFTVNVVAATAAPSIPCTPTRPGRSP